jgi:hypothetical protein
MQHCILGGGRGSYQRLIMLGPDEQERCKAAGRAAQFKVGARQKVKPRNGERKVKISRGRRCNL